MLCTSAVGVCVCVCMHAATVYENRWIENCREEKQRHGGGGIEEERENVKKEKKVKTRWVSGERRGAAAVILAQL